MSDQGTVCAWDSDRGFGFIKRDDGERDTFAHVSEILSGLSDLAVGTRVSFETKPGRDGRVAARHIRVI